MKMVEFREAEPADARGVAEVPVRSWQVAYRGHPGRAPIPTPAGPAGLITSRDPILS